MKILQLRWERILSLMCFIYYMINAIIHIIEYGFNFDSDMTIFLATFILIHIIYFATLNLRKNLIEWRKK